LALYFYQLSRKAAQGLHQRPAIMQGSADDAALEAELEAADALHDDEHAPPRAPAAKPPGPQKGTAVPKPVESRSEVPLVRSVSTFGFPVLSRRGRGACMTIAACLLQAHNCIRLSTV